MIRWPVDNPWPGAPVLYTETARSTMEEALKLRERGYPSGTVVVAGFQESGRGRLPERSWEAERGKNLLFTLMLSQELPFPAQRLPVLAGLALSLALEERYGLRTEVKWPNDLLFQGKKLAGILCEALSMSGGLQVFLIGIGVNVNQRAFPGELAVKACSLAQLLGRETDVRELLAVVLAAVRAILDDTRWREKLRARLYACGRQITIQAVDRKSSVRGALVDIAEDGALLLKPPGAAEAVAVYSGEIELQG